jgi:HEAT repeat protein
MGESPVHPIEAPGSSPDARGALSHREKKLRLGRGHVLSLIALAALSTIAGFLAGRYPENFAKWLKTRPVAAAVSEHVTASLASTPDPRRKNAEIEEISRLAPQQQAERLLELAVQEPELSLGLIRRNLSAWRGHLEETDKLFHLVLAALDSEDPRVRVAAVEVDLAACNLVKSPESVTKLLRQIRGEGDGRYLALWRLGAIGNRGVEPATALATLQRYARDRNQQARFWAVEGLAMLGTRESIDALLDILAHDPAPQIRESAARGLAQSGLLTGEQRLTAVPQLLNLMDDDSLDNATQNLVYATLEKITGASFGRDASAWRDWWAHHDRPDKRPHSHAGFTFI